jgi:surface protein
MFNLFDGATAFNQDIGSWNTAKVTQMPGMFRNAVNFNQDIGNWQTGHVINMGQMFDNATSFDQDISNWETDSVAGMALMFKDAVAFNQDIGTWDVGRVTNAASMFNGATSFNGNIENWNTGAMTSLNSMFLGATSFDRDLGMWDMSNVVNVTGFLTGAGLSVPNYDGLLIGWAGQTLQPGLVFDAGTSQYCTGEMAREELMTVHGWTIHDDGRNCCTAQTTWIDGAWDNGFPTLMHHVIFNDNYNTAINGGSIESCHITIDPGITLTVEAGDSIQTAYLLEVGGVLDVKEMGEVLLGIE